MRSSLEQGERQSASLEVEELPFSPESTAITDELSVGADDAMAGNDDGDAIVSVGARHGPHRGGLSDRLGQPGVGRRGSRRNTLELGPDAALEGRAWHVHRNVELPPFAGKIFGELIADDSEDRRLATLELAFERASHSVELRAEHAAVRELEQQEVRLGGCGDHRADWGLDVGHEGADRSGHSSQ
jgi:hypothetical protein